jgi:hypothetical protein
MASDLSPCVRASTSRPAPAPGGSAARPPSRPGTVGGGRCRWIRPAPRSSCAPPGPSPHARRASPPEGSPHPGRRHSSAPRPAHARDHFPRFIRPGKHGGSRSPQSARPRGRRTPTRLATVPTAADRLFMDGDSDAAAVRRRGESARRFADNGARQWWPPSRCRCPPTSPRAPWPLEGTATSPVQGMPTSCAGSHRSSSATKGSGWLGWGMTASLPWRERAALAVQSMRPRLQEVPQRPVQTREA